MVRYAALALLAATFLFQDVYAVDLSVQALAAGAPPVIDGRLDDAVWQGAEWSSGFSLLNKPEVTVEVQTLGESASGTFSVAASPDGRYILTGCSGTPNTAKLWDMATGAEVRAFQGHGWSVNSVAFSPDGTFVLTGSDDGTAFLWNTEGY